MNTFTQKNRTIMIAKEVFEHIKSNNPQLVNQKILTINNPTKEKEVIQKVLLYAEEYLLNNAWSNQDQKHDFIQNLAFLCSLSPFFEEKSKFYYDKYVHMLIDMEIPNLQANENIFYSFKSLSLYTFKDLANNTITISSPKKFNDPLDSPILLAAKKIFSNPPQKHELYFLQSLYKVRVKCFVPNKMPKTLKKLAPYLNTLMWSHYADSHKGICVKYKLSPSFIKRTDKKTGLFSYVKYINEPFNIASKSRFEFNECFLFKQAEWKYENEVRFLYFNADNSDDFQPIKLDKDSSIEAIYFGYQCPTSDKETIKKLFSNNSSIKFYQMEIDYSNIFQLKANEES